jgi:hypothetical protein
MGRFISLFPQGSTPFDIDANSAIKQLCDLALSAFDREPGAVAWIATKGDDVLYFSKHDGWSIESVVVETSDPIVEGDRG